MNRRQIAAWCLYDFANSSYSAVIAATIFARYYTQVIVGNEAGLGDLWWGRAQSLSMLFVALSSPYLGGLADAGGYRRRLFITYTWLTILCVASLTVLRPGMVLLGFALAALANVGQEGAMVFYNSYLPLIAPAGAEGRVSGWGYAVGYAGSIAALVAALPFTKPFRGDAIWLLVVVQYAVFSLPAFLWLPRDRRVGLGEAARQGFEMSRRVLGELWRRPSARRFLMAY